MKNYKNIIFDLGGVILDVNYDSTRRAFEALGVSNFDEMYSQADADQLFQNLETGKIDIPHFFGELNRCTGLQLTEEQITTAWNQILGRFREGTVRHLEQLKDRYDLYLFSNTNFIHMAAFEKIFEEQFPGKHLNDLFKKAFYSCEIGYRKPDAEAFLWCLDHVSIAPADSLFIDDSLQNVEAAEKLGMPVVHLKKGLKVEDLDL